MGPTRRDEAHVNADIRVLQGGGQGKGREKERGCVGVWYGQRQYGHWSLPGRASKKGCEDPSRASWPRRVSADTTEIHAFGTTKNPGDLNIQSLAWKFV